MEKAQTADQQKSLVQLMEETPTWKAIVPAASESKPAMIVDFATLTGAARVALAAIDFALWDLACKLA